MTIADIKEGRVRTWRKKLLDSGVSAVTTAKAYRLFRAILYTAVDDGIIRQPGYMVAELVIQRARPAGFEPATGASPTRAVTALGPMPEDPLDRLAFVRRLRES